MKSFFVGALLFLLQSHLSFSQETVNPSDKTEADTIEGISTDTSIVYIIKKPPVTIREKIEIFQQKSKQHYYFSLILSGFIYSEKVKPDQGYESYATKLKALEKPLPSIGFGLKFSRSKNKSIVGLSLLGLKFSQEYTHKDSTGSYNLKNNFNYCSIGIHIGHWFNKEKKISFSSQGVLSFDYFISTTGLTLSKSFSILPARLNRTISFNSFTGSIGLEAAVLFEIKNSYLEIGPYFIISPFSTTSKKEIYSLTRNLIGLKLAYTNKLF